MKTATRKYVLIDSDGCAISERNMTDEQYSQAESQISTSCNGAHWEESNIEDAHRWADSKRTGE